ncbi:SpoIIAA Anti-anti-sigma regulatory factor (antagonist of anti-sigma factor) [Rhabdaerophilaceae bacterium]
MKIEALQIGNITVVAMSGRLDSTNAAAADTEVMQAIGASQRVILDLAEVEYVSSAGLRIVLLVAKRLTAAHGKLVIAALNANVYEVFEVSGFLKILKVTADREAAVTLLEA